MDVGAGMYHQHHQGAGPPSPFHAVPYGVEIANRVFVGGCPYNMTEMELTQFFSKFGDVKDAKIITDRDGGKSRGYGFVTFATEEQAANVHSKGSIYYEQKKLNVSKAIRKHGGQYQKANQEYMNGQQRLVWLHPNGYLMTQQDSGWVMDQLSHSQPAKPFYSLLPPPSPTTNHGGGYYNYYQHPYMQPAPLGHTPMYGGSFYGSPYYPPSPTDDQTISVISATDSTSQENSSYAATPPSSSHVYFDMEALEAKTKQLSMDSAYTSEVDLESSHNASSGTTSPKEVYSNICSTESSAPSSPKQKNRAKDTQIEGKSEGSITLSPPPDAERGVVN